MFASVLPGIRELRAPLAVGFIWLAAVWVLIGDLIPTREESEDGSLASQFYVLTQALGPAALIAILTFTAYLIGVLLQFMNLEKSFTRPGRSWPATLNKSNASELKLKIHRATAPFTESEFGVNFLHDLLEPPKPGPSRDEALEFKHLYKAYVGAEPDGEQIRQTIAMQVLLRRLNPFFVSRIISDIPITTVQLQMDHKDVFDEWDRTRAEAQFRLAIALPLGALLLAVAIRTIPAIDFWSMLFFVASIGVTRILIYKGLQKRAESNDVVVRAILIGAIKAPFLELVATGYRDIFDNPNNKSHDGGRSPDVSTTQPQ